MPPKTLTAEQVAEIDRQQQPQRPVNWQSVIPQKEDVLTARVNRAARQDAPATLTAEQVDTAEAQNSVAAETSFGRAMGARPDRSAGPLAPGPKKVLSAREVQQINHDRVSDISYLPTMDEWREDQKFKAERNDSVGRFVEAGKAIAGGLFQAAAATAYAPFDFVARGTKAYDEWVNSSAEGMRQASISTAELWSWAGDVVNDSVLETERVNVIDNQLRQRLAAENKFTGNAQADAQIFAQARERAMASGAYGKTQEQEADDEDTQYQRFIRDRSFQQQAANITETNIGTLPDGRAEMGIDASKLNPGLVTTTALVADPLNIALPIGFGAVNKLRVLRRVASLTGTPLRGAGKAAGAMAQGSENIYSRIVEGVEDATGIGEAGQAAAVSAVSWKAAAAMATLKGSGRVLRNVERGLETGSILAREIGIGGVGVSRVEAAKKLRYAPIPERYRRAYDGFFTSPDSTLRRISETPGLSPIARRSAATLDKLGATQVFRATDDALSGALATAPIAVPLAAIAPEERRPEILGALMTVGAGAGIVGGKVRRMSEFDDALVAKMLADADISGGDAASLANALPHDKLVNMARMQSVISAKADFIPLRAKDYALDTTVNEAMGLGTRGIHVDAQKGKRPRIYLNIDKIATGDVAGHEIGHAIFRSNILGGEIKQGMRGMVDVQYGMDGIAARGREYVNSQLTQEVRDGTTGIQLNVLTPDEVQRIAAAGGNEAAEQALKQEFIRERWAKDADWRKQAIDERTDMLNQERLAQGETAWDWARDEIAAETFSGLGKGLNLSGIRASGPLGRAVGAAQATMEAMGARFKGNGRLESPNQLFVENPLFDTPEMRKAVSNYVRTYDRYLVGLEKEGKIKQRGTPIAPTGKASDAARSPHTRTYANTKNGVTVVESDLFIERPDGTRVPKSQEMINTQEKARAATLKSINDRTKFAEREGDWGARKLSNGRVEVGGPTLPLQFDNFIQVPEWLRIKARDFEAGRAEGRSYLYSYNAIGTGADGTYKVKNLGNVEAKVGEMVPFGWAVSQKNHLLSKVIDLNSFRAATMRAIDNEQLGEFGNNLRAVEAGLKQMLRNYQDGNPGETGLGVTKKNILNGLLGTGTVTQRQNNPAWYTLNNQGSVRTFRFDRLNYADPYGTGYFPHYNKININALPDDAGRMSMDSYRQFDADRKVAWMNKEAAKRGFSNATNWQGADPQGFQAADAQYRQEFPTESMPQQIPRSAQGMPDVAASGRGDGMDAQSIFGNPTESDSGGSTWRLGRGDSQLDVSYSKGRNTFYVHAADGEHGPYSSAAEAADALLEVGREIADKARPAIERDALRDGLTASKKVAGEGGVRSVGISRVKGSSKSDSLYFDVIVELDPKLGKRLYDEGVQDRSDTDSWGWDADDDAGVIEAARISVRVSDHADVSAFSKSSADIQDFVTPTKRGDWLQSADRVMQDIEDRLGAPLPRLKIQKPAITDGPLEAVASRLAAVRSKQQSSQPAANVNRQPSAAPRGQAMPDAVPADAPPFYMKSTQVLDAKIQGKAATVDQVRAILTNPQNGIKAEELKWTGALQAAERLAKENNGKVPKDALLKYLADDGAVRLEEVTYGQAAREARMRDQARADLVSNGIQNPAEAQITQQLEEFWPEYDDGGRDIGGERFGQHQLPGGENYREVVLAMPAKQSGDPIQSFKKLSDGSFDVVFRDGEEGNYSTLEEARIDGFGTAEIRGVDQYRSTHFPDTPDYVAHMRLNERTDAAGKRGLFLEEIQSDRHQAGREKGYKEDANPERDALNKRYNDAVAKRNAARDALEASTETGDVRDATDRTLIQAFQNAQMNMEQASGERRRSEAGSIPDAPFRKDWPMQMFKRALADAVGSGKEWIGWTTGETQAARYDLSKQVDALDYQKNQDGTYQLSFQKDRRGNMIGESIPADKLEEYVGKDVAQKITEGVGDDVNFAGNNEPRNIFKRLAGLNLKVGGEGMKGFYDQILPKEISKYVKQWGGQVEKSRIGQPKKHSGKLTRDELAEAKRDAKALINGDIDVAEFNDNWGTRLTDDDVPGSDPYRLNESATDLVSVVRKERELDAGGTFEAWRVNITPQMREGIKKAGQALFVGGMAAVVAEQEQQ